MTDSVSREQGAAGSPVGDAAGGGDPVVVFISYARRDAKDVAQRLKADLEAETGPDGRPRFRVWLDTSELRGGPEWDRTIRAALRQSRVVVAVLSAASVRGDAAESDSVCLDELAVARFQTPPSRIVPVMWIPVEPPLLVYRFHHIDMTASHPPGGDDYLAKYRELVDSIDHILTHGTERVRGVVENLKPLDFDSYIATRLEGFTGRGWVFDAIGEWRSRSEEGVSRLLLLTGPPGIGKSAIVAQLAHRNPGGQVLASFFCDARNSDTLRPESFVRTVAAQAASRIPEYATALNAGLLERELSEERFAQPGGAAVAFRQGVLDPLARVPAPADGSTRYLLVDGLDEAPPGDVTITGLLGDNLRRFPSWLRVVTTSRPVADITRDLGAAARVPLEAGDARNLGDVAAYILHRLEGGGELAQDLQRSGLSAPAAADALCDRAEGNFLYAQHVLDDIVTHRGEGCSLARLDRLPAGLPGLYHQFFSRSFRDSAEYDAKLRPLLEALVAARGPLPDALLAASVEMDEEEDLPRALRPLLQYLDESDGGHRFHHRSLGEWLVTADADDFQVSRRKGHGRLAVAGWAEYGKGKAESLAGYWLLHLPAHLEGAKRDEDAAVLQGDVDFLLRSGRLLREQGDAAAALERLRRLANVVAAEGFAVRLGSEGLERLGIAAMVEGAEWSELGDFTCALTAFEADLAIAERRTEQDPSNTDCQHDLAVSWNNVGFTRQSLGDLAGAQNAYEAGLAIRLRLTEQDPSNLGWQRDLSASWISLGGICQARGDLAGAQEAYETYNAIMRHLTEQDPSNAGWQRDLSVSWNRMGNIRQARGDLAGALEACEAGLAIMRRLTEQDPSNAGWQRDLSVSWNRMGGIRQARGDLAGALEAYGAMLAVSMRMTEQDYANTDCQRELSVSWNNVGGMREARGDLAGAQEAYEVSLVIRLRLTEQDPTNAGWQRDLSVSWNNVGDIRQARGDLSGAQEAYEAYLAIMQRLTHEDPSNAGWQRDLSVSWNKVGGIRQARGDLTGAQKAYEEGLAIMLRLTEQHPTNTRWQRDLSLSWNWVGGIRQARGDLAGAQKAYEEGLAIMLRLTELDPSNAGWRNDLAWSHVRLARTLDAMSREEDAAAHWREAYRLLSEMRAKREHLDEADQQMLDELHARLGRGGVDPDTPPDAD